MNERLNWDDVRLFHAVARSGGLSAARVVTGLSSPTLGRRMAAMERAMGVALFDRRRDGYRLTAAGLELLRRSEVLEQGAIAIQRWRTTVDPQPLVRVAAGGWTSVFIARHFLDGADPSGTVEITILPGTDLVDISRRQSDLGIRNRRPRTPGLAVRRLGRVEFAAYGSPTYVAGHPASMGARRFHSCDWVVYEPHGPDVPSASWLRARLGRRPVLRCSQPYPILAAAAAGAGLCVLPCFIGDREPGLLRISDPIAELGHDQWLVSHDDDRHSAPVRKVANRLARMFLAHKTLLAGRCNAAHSADG
jgi:DNA-binding transcriptional LysR family regulator